MIRPVPELLVAASCWETIVAELDRVYPDEGIAVPLVALVPRASEPDPCAPLRLGDLRALVVPRVVLVPREAQQNLPARVSVRAGGDERVNAQVAALCAEHPRLRACAYLHSHPFAHGRTWPSRGPGCDVDGHMLPLLERNREAGLETSFSLIAAPGPGGWQLHGFALDGGEVVGLGLAQVVSDESALIRRLLLPHLERRAPQRHLLRRWRRALRRAHLRFSSDELFEGWLRTVVEVDEHLRVVILLPLEFPSREPRFYVAPSSGEVRRAYPSRGPRLAPEAWLAAVRELKESVHG